MTDTATVHRAIRALADIIADTVAEAGPLGVPSGHVYAILMTAGVTLPVYETMVRILHDERRIIRRGDVLYPPARPCEMCGTRRAAPGDDLCATCGEPDR